MTDALLLVIIACEDTAQAERIGEHLLKKKLAACVQTVSGTHSMFLWPPQKNTIDYAEEALLLVKTLNSKWASVETAVRTIHSYKNPEIIALPVTHTTKSYEQWITKELA